MHRKIDRKIRKAVSHEKHDPSASLTVVDIIRISDGILKHLVHLTVVPPGKLFLPVGNSLLDLLLCILLLHIFLISLLIKN